MLTWYCALEAAHTTTYPLAHKHGWAVLLGCSLTCQSIRVHVVQDCCDAVEPTNQEAHPLGLLALIPCSGTHGRQVGPLHPPALTMPPLLHLCCPTLLCSVSWPWSSAPSSSWSTVCIAMAKQTCHDKGSHESLCTRSASLMPFPVPSATLVVHACAFVGTCCCTTNLREF